MKSNNPKLTYKVVNLDNYKIAFDIQKSVWSNIPDESNFIEKATKTKDDFIAFIAYYENKPVGITGVYTEDELDKYSIWLDWYCVLPEYRKTGLGKQILLDTIEYAKSLKRFLYFRAETTYWENRPAVILYDKVMPYKEKYTIEYKETPSNTLIYTYNFTNKMEYWDNKNLHLFDYYFGQETCKDSLK